MNGNTPSKMGCFLAERGGQFSNSLFEDLKKLQILSEELEKELQQADFEFMPNSLTYY